MVLTQFGGCFEYKNPPSNATSADVRQWLVDHKSQTNLLPVHKDVIKLIHSQTRKGLADDDVIKYFDKNSCILYAVSSGTDENLTDAEGEADIYTPTLRNKLHNNSLTPEAPAAAAVASAAGLNDSDSDATDDDTVEVKIPSNFEVTGMFTYEDGYHQPDNPTTISVTQGSQVFYFQRFLITPGILQRIVEEGGNELANLLCCTKIGESGSPEDGFDKFGIKRTGICFARLHFVMFILRVNSLDIETCLHSRFALKQGDAHGEFYAELTDLDFFEMIEHFKRYHGMTILFGMTKVQNLQDYNTASSGKGFVYRARPKWNNQQLSVIDAMQRNHPNENSSMPFLPTITCNTNAFRDAIHAIKIGMTKRGSVEEVGSYLGNKLLWSNGMVPSGAFNCIECDDAGEDEKTLHHDLQSFHIVGEWFKGDATSTLTEFDSLFNGESHTFSRSRDHFWLSKNALRRSIDFYGIMTYRLVWEHIKHGAMIYFPNGKPGRSNDDLSSIAQAVLPFMDPRDRYPLRRSEILDLIRFNMAANDYERMDEEAVKKDYTKADGYIKRIKVKLGNRSSFTGIDNNAAIDAFVAIFGEESRSICEQFSIHP